MKILEASKEKLKFGKTKLLKQERKLKKKRSVNVVVIGFYVVLAGVIFFTFQSYVRTGFINEKVNGLQVEAKQQFESINQSNFVSSPAGEDYSERFVREYINIPSDPKERAARATKLGYFFAEGLVLDELENLTEFKGNRILKQIHLYDIRDIQKESAVFVYRINYDTVNDIKEKKPAVNKTMLIAVPIGTNGKSFSLIEQPYFEMVPAGERLAVVKDPGTKTEQNFENKEELKAFTEQFFSSYTENTIEEMSYFMEDPKSLAGLYQYKGLSDFIVYNGEKGEWKVKALVELKDVSSNLSIKQPVTLTVSKENGKFIVKEIKHTIGG